MLKCENLPSTNSTKSGTPHIFSKTSTSLGKIYSFAFFEYFDAFEIDASIANFVHYGETRLDDFTRIMIIVK